MKKSFWKQIRNEGVSIFLLLLLIQNCFCLLLF
eukprot:UN06431